MTNRTEEEWEREEDWLRARSRHGRRDADEDEPPQQPSPRSLEDELLGAVYYIPHHVWDFVTRQPKDRPGVCVACDVATRWTWLSRGVDAGSPVTQNREVIVVVPSGANGLEKETAFLVEPYGVRLHRLLTFHSHPRLVGRLEQEYLGPMRGRFLEIIEANRREEA